MRIRMMGMVDKTIELDEDESQMYEEASAEGKLAYFMDSYLSDLDIEITYGKEDEFDGNPI